ncbi:unnamed protein product [Effrenium voratum]|nr:unnamed protein product [Effrenium voratum]
MQKDGELKALHSRAAAGELAGWAHHGDTCLALVVILDQFSRSLYRGTPSAYACDVAARAAANAALVRGDDKCHPPGPRRWALYLPFMHSEDLQDKVRCVNLMREGLGKSLFKGSAEAKALPKLNASGGALSKESFTFFKSHLEFASPSRGNNFRSRQAAFLEGEFRQEDDIVPKLFPKTDFLSRP